MFEEIVSFQARYRPDAPAIWTPIGGASFASFDADINRMARRLQPLVPARGCVAVQAANPGLHWVVTLALARLGCVSASLPPVGERPEAELLAILRPDLLLTDRGAAAAGLATFELSPDWVQETFRSTPDPIAPHRFGPDEVVRLVMSSGTTGAPKKMALTRRMVDNRVKTGGLSQLAHRRLHSAVGLDAETGFRAPLTAWATGKPMLYPETGFRWADFFQAARPEAILLVPAQLDAILQSLPTGFQPIAGLSLVLISGSLPPGLYRRARALLTSEIYVTYGSTEAGLAAQASAAMLAAGDAATGVVSPSAALQIVDAEDRPMAPDAVGRVRVRTEEMVDGYLDDEALTRAFFRDGWFYPGDLGTLSASGRLTLHGRDVEVLDLGGVRITPDAIEAALLERPGVRDAAAFSVASADGVGQARAAIVCEPGCDLDAVKVALRRALPQLSIGLVVVAEIPRSDRGKVQRDVLRASAAAATPV